VKIVLVPGKFYESKNGKIWCCFHFDPAKEDYAQALCVCCTTSQVQHFFRNGWCEIGPDENTLVSMLPYWGADGDARQQFASACADARKEAKEELREMIDKCKTVLTHANRLVETLEEALDR